MKPNITRLLAALTVLGMGGGLTGVVHAEAYALSYQDLVSTLAPGTYNGSDPTTWVSDFSLISVDPSTPLSGATASLNLSGVTTGGTGATDAPAANAPFSEVTRINNVFNFFGPSTTQTYSNADAWIPFEQTGGDPYTQTTSIAEANISGTGSADSNAENSSVTGFEVNVTLAADTRLRIDVVAEIIMRALISADSSVPPSQSFAEITATASIINSSGVTVFSWAPDGTTSSGISGGVDYVDDKNLNTNLQTVNPGDDFSYGGLGTFYNFMAITDILAAGDYTIALAMETDTSVQREPVQVPEPATLAMMGIGLLGLGASRRRRKA